MRYLLILLFILVISSCEDSSKEAIENVNFRNYEIVVIDSCEYIISAYKTTMSHKGHGFMAHKGNCKNEFHNGEKK